jgi:RimJ/RimL family protein N-acetyltransferase
MELRDGDLLLRPYRPDDADAVTAAMADDDIVRFIPAIPEPYTRADAEAWISRCAEALEAGSSYTFAIVSSETGELHGSIEIHVAGGAVGYWIAAGARNRGIATRAVRLVCGWWRRRPLHLTTHPDNGASQRVAEKAGFRRVGTTTERPVFRDGTSEAVLFELSD